MTSLRTAAFAAVLLAGAALQPAHAMTVAPLAGTLGADVAKTEFSFADALAPGRPYRVDALATDAAAASYFNFDALITLGALVLAGGVLGGVAVGAARRRAEEIAKTEPHWRASVLRALQAELAEFSGPYRRAA